MSSPDETSNRLFLELLGGFRSSGGLARDSEVSARVVARHPDGFVWLARRIASRALVFVCWEDALWFPMFQFERAGMSLRRGPARVADELLDWTDDWERARWFVRPHLGLDGQAPVEVVSAQPERVVEAARLDRFACRG